MTFGPLPLFAVTTAEIPISHEQGRWFRSLSGPSQRLRGTEAPITRFFVVVGAVWGGGCVVRLVGVGLYCTYVRRWGVSSCPGRWCGRGAGADGDAAPTFLTDESGTDATLVAVAEGLRVVGVEEAGSTGVLGLGACGLGELAAACHRLAPWAAWGESLAAACLTGCGELSARPGQWGPGGQVSPVVGFEERRFNTACLLSARLGVSRARAGQIVDHGNALMNIGFNPTEVMERCGVLDSVKASLVTRRLEDVPVPVALAVQDQVLPQAPRRSVSQVGRDIERALIEVDPDGHTERTRATVSRRCVSRPRPVGEVLCQVRLLLPTMDALLLDAALDAIAASARACGEQRTPAQIRADAITAITLQTLRTSQMAPTSPLRPGQPRHPVPGPPPPQPHPPQQRQYPTSHPRPPPPRKTRRLRDHPLPKSHPHPQTSTPHQPHPTLLTRTKPAASGAT